MCTRIHRRPLTRLFRLVPTFRVCVGRHFAESTLFILCASVLAAFDIGPPIDEDGVPVEIKWEATDHLVVS